MIMPAWFTPALMKQLMWLNCAWYLLLAVGFALTLAAVLMARSI